MAIRRLERTKQKRAVAANETLVRRFVTGFLTGRDVAVAEQLLADGFMSHDADLGESRSSFIMFFDELFRQMPEIGFEEVSITSDGDFVWVLNDLFESETSVVPFVSSVDIWRVEGEQLVEHWNVVQEHASTSSATASTGSASSPSASSGTPTGSVTDPSVHQGNGGQEAFSQLGPWPFQGLGDFSFSSDSASQSGVFEGEQNGFGRVVRAFQSRMDEEWQVGAARDLEIIERDSWDGNEARRNMLEAGVDVARRGHLVWDSAQQAASDGDEGTQSAYRLPFADVVDGELMAVDSGLRAAASRLPQTEIPDDVRERARAVLDFYFEQMEQQIEEEEEEERVTKSKRVTMRGPGSTGSPTGLAAYLNDQIDQLVSDDRSRDDIIGEIAEESGDSPSVVREILSGEIIRPDDDCLAGFAEVLGVPLSRLKELAQEDWDAHQANRQVENNLFRRVMRSIARQFGDEQDELDETDDEDERDEALDGSGDAAGDSSLSAADSNSIPRVLREMMQTRDIGLAQVVDQVNREIDSRDPDDWNLWHWFKDLYFDDQAMYAITVSAGQLWRWPVMVANGDVTLGEPFAVEVEFVPAPDRMMVRQDEDGRLWGFGPLCTATVNKAGILDSRGLFDSFVERFEGDGFEYLNILHLNGDKSRIGSLRHVYRDEKVLAGIYEFDRDDPIAVAAARTLMDDTEGYWGGSIEFDHYGALEMIEVAEGISLPTTVDGKLFGYSIARNQDCCAWYTGNSVHSVRSMSMAMSAKDREVALELLKDEELVNQLEDRIGMTNEGLRDAITYTLSGVQGQAALRQAQGPEAEGDEQDEASGDVDELDERDERDERDETDEQDDGLGDVDARQVQGRTAERRGLIPASLEDVDGLRAEIQALAMRVDGLAQDSSQRTIELDASVLSHVGDTILNSQVFTDIRTQLAGLRDDLNTTTAEIHEQVQSSIGVVNGAIEQGNAQIEERLAALEEEAGLQIETVAEQADVLASRLSQLEQEEEERMRQHDAARPPGQTVTVALRPREHNRTFGPGNMSGKRSKSSEQSVTPVSAFAEKARAVRMGESG